MLSEFHLHAGKILTVKVLMDSNFLLVPFQFKLDIFEELSHLLNQKYYPIILSTMWGELERLSERCSPRMRRRALMALKLAGKCEMLQVEEEADEVHDDVMVRVAKDLNCLVATNDRELRKRLRNINIPVIYLREKSRLEIEGPLP